MPISTEEGCQGAQHPPLDRAHWRAFTACVCMPHTHSPTHRERLSQGAMHLAATARATPVCRRIACQGRHKKTRGGVPVSVITGDGTNATALLQGTKGGHASPTVDAVVVRAGQGDLCLQQTGEMQQQKERVRNRCRYVLEEASPSEGEWCVLMCAHPNVPMQAAFCHVHGHEHEHGRTFLYPV